jgi:YD repeat-containing protein
MMNGPSNILSSWFYSNRLQPCRMAVNTTGSAPSSCTDTHNGNVVDLTYGFGSPSNNGNVTKVSDSRTGMSGRSVNYAYDTLNRITQAYTDATSGSYCWAETFTIDRFSNLTGIGSKSDHPGCSQESLNLTATWQNRLSTGFGSDYQYDAAGNLTRTPSPESASYTYNAEDQVTQASDFFTAGYLYDGDGKRVAKTSGGTPYQLYWYGTNSAPLAVSDGSGNFTDEYIFFAGKRIARRVVSGQ